MQKDSYESILRAVGRVLDQVEADHFAVSDQPDGLRVEAFDAEGSPKIAVHLDVADVAHLVDAVGPVAEAPHYERAASSDEGTLTHFLTRHERALITAR